MNVCVLGFLGKNHIKASTIQFLQKYFPSANLFPWIVISSFSVCLNLWRSSSQVKYQIYCAYGLQHFTIMEVWNINWPLNRPCFSKPYFNLIQLDSIPWRSLEDDKDLICYLQGIMRILSYSLLICYWTRLGFFYVTAILS